MLQQKKQRVAEWIRKQDPYTCSLQEMHLRSKDTHRLTVTGWKKIFPSNRKENKAGVAVLIPDKTDFKTKVIVKDKGYYIMIKRTIQQ